MSNYAQLTNFTAKDALTTGDPAKIVKGSDIDGELSAISAAIATKYDSSNYPFASGTKLPFYQQNAPTGWTDQALNDLALVAVTQASTNGGTTTGSWAITGLTVTDPGHSHGSGSYLVTTSPITVNGTGAQQVASQAAYSVAGSSASAFTSISVAGNGAWRPARAYVIICSKN